MLQYVITLANFKGGIGKSTSTELQNYQKGLTPRIGISPNFYFSKLTCPCVYAYESDEVLADNNILISR